MTGGIEITPQARRYVLGELCRRACLDEDFRSLWSIEASADGQTLALRARDPYVGRIEFPAHPGGLRSDLVVHKSWPVAASSEFAAVVPDFVVPFARRESKAGEPLFAEVSRGHFRCTEDLLASTVLVLSRYEELDSPRQDAHGRFEAAASMAVRDGYLDRPIIDEYGLALESVIRRAGARLQAAPAPPARQAQPRHR